MNPDSENFEQLQRALKLKRYEVPPPGYFNNFSSKVIARIQAGELGQTKTSWWQRVWASFEAKPIMAGGLGAAVCGLLAGAILVTEESGTTPVNIAPVATTETSPVLVDQTPLMAFNQSQDRLQVISSTNPVAPSINSLFDQFQVQAQPASFSLGGN
jgi:hypothetical protein